MDGGLEIAGETGSLVFLVGKLKTCKMERKTRQKRKDIEEIESSPSGTGRIGVFLW